MIQEFLEALQAPQVSEYFYKILQTLKAFLKVVKLFLELLQAIQSSPSFKIFPKILQTLQDFLKVGKHFLELLQAIQSSPSFRILFTDFTNTQGVPEGGKTF